MLWPGEGRDAYRADESKLTATGEMRLAFPQTTGQLAYLLKRCAEEGISCVLSGGRTGVSGAAVPERAQLVISCERMTGVLAFGQDAAGYYIRCQPGVTLADLNRMLISRRFDVTRFDPASAAFADFYARRDIPELWLPVNPTETGAQLGGMTATNASGSRTYRYGPLRNWVRALDVILPGGELLRLRRGDSSERFSGYRMALVRRDGIRRELVLPEIPRPQTKCTCGYYCQPDMELIDLLIGSEGTLGAFAEIEMRLEPRPAAAAGVQVFLRDEEQAIELAGQYQLNCAAVEYFDREALQLVQARFPGKFNLATHGMVSVYLEFRGTDSEVGRGLEALAKLLLARGWNPEETWAEDQPAGCERQREFRHAVPEAVNQMIAERKRIHPELHKVGTDMAVPLAHFAEVLKTQRAALAYKGLQSVVFGHIGDGHVHINILPRTPEELMMAKELYRSWAKEVVCSGGAVAAEHGIGRLKRGLLAEQYPKNVIESMRGLRYSFDNWHVLARGVLFD